ncbi:hypothetical protein K458DRAFT_372123 [Lentithecium fluviatile CBS 122367]|uniref:Cora-domain-containing protein n=1 Tax=Lentithecium fluviatile CBS 122367 TaxID=1168545 RepID=A0A6G1ITI5_9PLEO|nr:hypothetical protein K458DRAFT_372123 [Lentithecium fluviatile CBS 122367]
MGAPPERLDDICEVRVHAVVPDCEVTWVDTSIRKFLAPDFNPFESSEPTRSTDHTNSDPASRGGFRWIHIPVNNLAWVERCFQKCGRTPDRDLWTKKIRPTLSRNIGIPLHARHMEPSCDGTDPPEHQLALFLPYLNWDTFGNYKSLRAVYECWEKRGDVAKLPAPNTTRGKLEHALFPYLKPKDSLHPRRTLDQFYYSSLPDTAARDADQTVSKWTGTTKRASTNSGDEPNSNAAPRPDGSADPEGNTGAGGGPSPDENVGAKGSTGPKGNGPGPKGDDPGPDGNAGPEGNPSGEGDPGPNGRNAALDDSLLIMVDQLWCWIIDSQTVLSFFPSQDAQYTSTGFCDLYSSILSKAGKCADVFDFYALVAKKATNYFFNETDRTFTDLIGLYRWVVSKKAADQTLCFENFHLHYANGIPGAIVLDDRAELKLVLEIADIIDELNMMQYLFKQQRDVLQSLIQQLREHKPSTPQPDRVQNLQIIGMTVRDQAVVSFNIQRHADNFFEIENTKALANGIGGIARDHVISTDEKLLSLRAEIAAIINDAENVRNTLLNLLDLKSKTASLLEARSSTKQGRAVMLFTIVTIIFLPLSFFTSYFGQNVSEITGDPKNPTSWHLWRIATPITIIVVAVAFIVAFYIGKPDSRVWGHGRRAEDVERQGRVTQSR